MRYCLLCLLLLLCRFPLLAAGSNYETNLPNFAAFKTMQGEPLTLKYGGVTAVKVVFDIKDKKVYFLNSARYRFHYEFCVEQLGELQSLIDFNAYNYSTNRQRSYVFATINHYPAKNLFTLEFAATEELSDDNLQCYQKVIANCFLGDSLKFFASTNRQLNYLKTAAFKIPIITVKEVYGGLTYQPIVQKKAYGFLRKVAVQDLNHTPILPNDILLINGSPLDIPVCAGIITSSFQAPLSHICILCQNRQTPLMAYKGIFENEALAKLINQPIELSILQDTFLIRPLSLSELQNKLPKKSTKKISLPVNLSIDTLVSVRKIDCSSISFAGGKASNLGELFKIRIRSTGHIYLPEKPLVIPFYFYDRHVHQGKIAATIQRIVSDSLLLKNDSLLKKLLKQVRKQIMEAPIDSALLQQVLAKLQANTPYQRFRFRSSTNAEDIEGFNGAGLYDSKTGILGDTIHTVEKAIKKVWASVWNERAFKERAYFNIDQSKIAMAVLVHPAFGAEAVNGVAVTKNLYRSDYPGYTVNLQLGEVPVVNSPDSVAYEQLLIHWSDVDPSEPKIVADYLSLSSLNNYQPLLTDEQLAYLNEVLIAIKKQYYYQVNYRKGSEFDSFAMDVELKWIGPEKKMYVKQARVYCR